MFLNQAQSGGFFISFIRLFVNLELYRFSACCFPLPSFDVSRRARDCVLIHLILYMEHWRFMQCSRIFGSEQVESSATQSLKVSCTVHRSPSVS